MHWAIDIYGSGLPSWCWSKHMTLPQYLWKKLEKMWAKTDVPISTRLAQNALALASGRPLVSLTVRPHQKPKWHAPYASFLEYTVVMTNLDQNEKNIFLCSMLNEIWLDNLQVNLFERKINISDDFFNDSSLLIQVSRQLLCQG